jgi:DinB superfamily
MARFTDTDEFAGAEFIRVDMSRTRFVRTSMEDAWMRAVYLAGAVIEATFLNEGTLHINGVDVVPLIEAELERRNPGRALRRSSEPEGLRDAWAAVEAAWAATLERVAAMPAGTADVSVEGEWTFSQTLRHLTFAIDAWLRKGVLDLPEAYHPYGQPHRGAEGDGFDMSLLTTDTPAYSDVVDVFTARQAMVRDFLTTVTSDQLAEQRPFVWGPDEQVTVLDCLHVILNESWEHHRYAVRDLDAIAGNADA